jgi:hypothetical protein
VKIKARNRDLITAENQGIAQAEENDNRPAYYPPKGTFYLKKNGLAFANPLFNLAEEERFELSNAFASPVFKTGAFSHSATPPE